MVNYTKIIWAILFGYFLSVSTLFVTQFIHSYSNVNENVLANGAVIGGDFPILYVGGSLFREDRPSLYDYDIQLAKLRALFAGTPQKDIFLVFIYPPLVAALFSLLSTLSLLSAYLTWSFINLCLFAISTWLVLSRLEIPQHWKWLLALSGFAFVPFLANGIGGGQLSPIGMLLVSVMFVCRRSHQPVGEGVMLGCGYYKPPLFLFLSFALIFTGRFRQIVAAAAAMTCLMGLSVYLIGLEAMWDYLQIASRYRYGEQLTAARSLPVEQGVGLYSVLSKFLPAGKWSGICYIASLALGIALIRRLRAASPMSPSRDDLIFALEISLSVFLSIQVINYDLTLLLPAIYIVAGRLLQSELRFETCLVGAAAALLHLEWLLRSAGESVQVSPFSPAIVLFWIVALGLWILQHAGRTQLAQ